MITRTISTVAVCATALMACICTLRAATVVETFGSGANAFSISFVDIGNAGNGDDAGAGGGQYSSPYGGVSYNYRMAVTEVPQDWITKATNLGMANVSAGAWTGTRPAANMTWYEAAAFVNFLNTQTGHHAAYQIDAGVTGLTLWSSAQAWQAGGENLFRHKDAHYFLPSEDEWYKAAYHKNDGVTANYWDYATGSNNIPTQAEVVYGRSTSSPPDPVDNNGAFSPYGTRGQNGNVAEWQESASDGINDFRNELRAVRGGDYRDSGDVTLRSSTNEAAFPQVESLIIGFRVASVPEPAATSSALVAGLICSVCKRRR